MIIKQFNLLTPAELIIVEEHLKLGLDHLRQHLSKAELRRLLRSLSLHDKQMSNLEGSHTEIVSNLFLVLNTILTATFGAWMGYSAVLGVSLGSAWIFGSIIALAASVGALIGYVNIRITKKRSQTAIDNQKLHFLQLEILKKIEEKRKRECSEIFHELDDIFLHLKRGTSFEHKEFSLDLTCKSMKEISDCLSDIAEMSREKLAKSGDKSRYHSCESEITEILKDMKKNAASFFRQKDSFEVIHEDSRKAHSIDPLLKKLITTSPKESSDIFSWIKANVQALVLGLVPTVLGGFSSLSVYWGGVPSILEQFGKEDLFLFFTSPYVRGGEFALSLLITLYFGFSFIYINRKDFQRSQELEKTNKIIVQKESSLTVLDAHMVKLKEFKRSSLELKRFFRLISPK